MHLGRSSSLPHSDAFQLRFSADEKRGKHPMDFKERALIVLSQELFVHHCASTLTLQTCESI
ncbi:hypothetical protein Cflav_PD3918 [Pedosphaera parvula Ellin514]|uniref:Uncharacterized protein n=1 Tax=Pedosphaera parvula (strain Ellin514) TaxID=320771 RepID=B9XG39_PEDPL|nr:hypothetical protein Cflav_PD3918 [Pedosphaera parvula Ellin514]